MNLPNKLTLFRMCMVPVFIACFYIPFKYVDYVAAVVFFVAFMTDVLDGYIARKNEQVTNFGKFMDPIADKMLVLSAFIMLCGEGRIPAIVAVGTTMREIVISAIRLVVADEGHVIAASVWGKLKTVLQCIAVMVVLCDGLVVAVLGFSVSTFFVWASFAATLISLIDYIIKNYKYIDLTT